MAAPVEPIRPAATADPSLLRILAALLVTGVCGYALLRAGVEELATPAGQWDFEVYYYALKVRDAGGNPWDHAQLVRAAGGAVHHLNYPPHVLPFFRLFYFDDLQLSKQVFLAAKLAVLAALLTLWLRAFIPAGFRGWFLAFAALGFNAALARDLVVGNISIFEQALIWFGLYALLRRRPLVFVTLITLAGQAKVLPLALLALVLAADVPHRGRWFLGGVGGCGLIALAVYLAWPEETRYYLALQAAVGMMEPGSPLNPCLRALVQDLIQAAQPALPVLQGRRAADLALPVYAAAAAVIVAATVWAIRRGRDPLWAWYLGLCGYALTVPRMKDYSFILLLVPVFELLRPRLTGSPSGRGLAVGILAVLAAPGTDMLWEYRPLLLAGWAWAVSLHPPAGPEAGPRGERGGSGGSPLG